MLVLTRKEQESISIGENIEIVVVEVSEGKVKLGIKAPKDISILRTEIRKAVEAENISATKAKPENLKKLYKK